MSERRDDWLARELRSRGVSRRDFMAFCATMAATLALPDHAIAQIARAIQKVEKPILVWLEFQDCAGNTEGFLRASRPTASELILDVLSLDYHETVMAAAGHQAEENLAQTVKNRSGAYITIIEGSIPAGANGGYCTIGGRAVTELKNAELRKGDYIEDLERIAFMTSHNVRGPIATMLGLVELLRMNAIHTDQWNEVLDGFKKCIVDLDFYTRELGAFIYQRQRCE